jgi:CheY-like chemotaxis protein
MVRNLHGGDGLLDESAKPLLLHVDDDDLLAYLVQREITAFEVRRVCDGEQAVRFLTDPGAFQVTGKPAIIVLDLHMPKKDGFATMREIRAHPAFARIPIVVFTTSQDPVDRARAFAFGADHFLQKPADLNGFAEIAGQLADIVARKNIDWKSGDLPAPGPTVARLDAPEE